MSVLALVLLSAPPSLPPPRTGATSPAVADDPTSRVILRCDPADFAPLSAELRARWPHAELLEYGTEAFDRVGGRPFVYLEVSGERVGDAPMSITLITSDGRAYLRHVTPKDAERTRMVAIAGANLLAAVADEDVPPDREQATVPLPSAEVPSAPPEPPPRTDTAPPREPVPPPVPPRPRTIPPPREPHRGWQLALDPAVAMVVGLAPSARRGAPIFGGDLRLDARAPIGLATGAGVRVLAAGTDDYRLTRVRVTATVGWIGRAGRLEWAALLGPTFEPWRVLQGRAPLRLASHNGGGFSVLYGAALHGVLGYRVPLPSAVPSALRIGARVELGASSLGSGNAARVLERSTGRPLFELGGLELGVALDLALWFDLRPLRRDRSNVPR